MLRESAAATGRRADLSAVVDRSVVPRLAAGVELLDFVDAVLLGGDVDGVRSRLEAVVGRAGVVDAAGVVGNFEMMNRVADATGMPVSRGSRRANADLIEDLGLERFDHLD